MDITMGIAQYAMQMSEIKTGAAVQTSMMKNVMELEEATMDQLLASLGQGGNMNISA